jgi:hypothetical protein
MKYLKIPDMAVVARGGVIQWDAQLKKGEQKRLPETSNDTSWHYL